MKNYIKISFLLALLTLAFVHVRAQVITVTPIYPDSCVPSYQREHFLISAPAMVGFDRCHWFAQSSDIFIRRPDQLSTAIFVRPVLGLPDSVQLACIYYNDSLSTTDTLTHSLALYSLHFSPYAAYLPKMKQEGTAPLAVDFVNLSSPHSTSPITSIYWDFGDTGTSTADSVSHTYTVPGSYNPVLVVTDSTGCSSSTTLTGVGMNVIVY